MKRLTEEEISERDTFLSKQIVPDGTYFCCLKQFLQGEHNSRCKKEVSIFLKNSGFIN